MAQANGTASHQNGRAHASAINSIDMMEETQANVFLQQVRHHTRAVKELTQFGFV